MKKFSKIEAIIILILILICLFACVVDIMIHFSVALGIIKEYYIQHYLKFMNIFTYIVFASFISIIGLLYFSFIGFIRNLKDRYKNNIFGYGILFLVYYLIVDNPFYILQLSLNMWIISDFIGCILIIVLLRKMIFEGTLMGLY
ncbi:MAG TPA: hypothetical protein QF753_12460 [Victivallales bacterium]|nr:hypothetical protein [Victivallales bacterium]